MANDRKGDKYGSMDTFDMYMHMFSFCLPPHHHQPMEAAFGRLHKGGRAAFGGAPTFVDSIVGDGEAANIAKRYACTYDPRTGPQTDISNFF